MQLSSTMGHSGKSKTRENVSCSFQLLPFFFPPVFVYILQEEMLPAFATGLCPCHTNKFLNSIVIIQLPLRQKTMLFIELLFIKDIWSSFVTCPLGKPGTTSAMAMLYKICYFKRPEPWLTCAYMSVMDGWFGFSLFTKEVLKSLQTHVCCMNHLDVHSLTGKL